MTDLLRISQLSLAFGEAPALFSNLSCEIMPGESVGLAGPSGTGKSLLTTTLLGLAPPAARVLEGQAAYQLKSGLAVNLLELDRKERAAIRGREIGLVFQEPYRALNPVLTCGSQLREAIRLLASGQTDPEQYLAELLDRVELSGLHQRVLRSLPSELSGGQLQRVVIAMALVGRPRLLIADEPTTALDGITEAAIVRLLDRLRRELRMGLLFITHNRRLLERATDRVIELPVASGLPQGGVTPPPVPIPPPTPPDATVRLRNLNVRYGTGDPVLQDVSLDLQPGEILALTGPSGCGKTTLASWLVGLVEGSSGTFTVAPTEYTLPAAGRTVRQATGAQLIFQDVAGSLNPRMRVQQLINSVPGNAGAQVDQCLTAVGLEPATYAKRLPHELSGGERQRVAIARALAARPRILICDESFSGLDEPSRRALQSRLRALAEQQRLTVLLITHSLSDIREFADRVVLMDGGRVVEVGPPAVVFAAPKSAVGRQLVDAAGLG